jgi:hypothetical protein
LTLRNAFSWLRDEKNHRTVKMVGGAFAAAVVALWTVYVHFYPAPDSKPTPHPANVQSDCGSVAVSGNVTGRRLQRARPAIA